MKIIEGTIASPKGFSADGVNAGFKRKKLDFGWVVSSCPASVAGVYTTNQVIAAPLVVTRDTIASSGKIQAIVVNSGIANSCTGQEGYDNALLMQKLTAETLGLPVEYVAIASTGLIGEQLSIDKVKVGLDSLEKGGNPALFAQAILTTDLKTKTIVMEEEIAGTTITMAGVAKGSGMIHPNMATMLGFVTCDANISSDLLQKALKKEVETTFNQITVDGDTSTNDMVLVLANGCADHEEIKDNTPEYATFCQLLNQTMTILAKKIAEDGEGATKLIQVDVDGAPDDLSARMIAKTVVGSSLVKTAMFGEDPNWGRILSAVGYAGVHLNVSAVDLYLADIPVLKGSAPVPYDQDIMAERLGQDTIIIHVHLNQGQGQGRAWGCDLSYDYVKINALYHT
ncbi:bifunctional glutamate N-acetyltransferase/amino-acid acetyltransferase ArgJ [Streptococcus moroccensis]|uniref:Arginine biosynthesis bifunctional protein ArgJ n=1 Tax=Streptococcus moroccensis TaxID=1451356 RepID=A0ABT9YNX3_9STRE|nr:bifunctional glutamate N-acetyltransferase/amino-acid acetyltransferase ArgJ [Streptococcus moroccensis]MDQ0221475.1 glutamate N-acetyltransferase/amino-acid N-acetyltransferase [Streptococcus moroccensis]